MLNLFITSSNHKSGQTFVTNGIAATMQSLGYTTSVYKPIQLSGIERGGFMQSPDLTDIKAIDPYINTHFTYLFKSSSEPLIASESENEQIDIELINAEFQKISSVSDCTIVSSDGGILSPIAPNLTNADIIRKIKTPMLIVTSPNNDAVNSTLLTIEAALNKEIEVRGVVINNITSDCSKELLNSIPRVIEEYTNINVLGLIPQLKQNYKPEDIISAILNGLDIESIFNVRIEKLDMN